MKRLFSYLVIISLFLSCADDDTGSSTLIGKWKLAQVLVDPGDGSGTFMDVNSDKTIDFLSNGTFLSTGDLCNMFTLDQLASTGTFSDKDAVLYPSDCENAFGDGGLNYFIESGALTIYYQCIEACAERYVKVE